MRSSIPSVLFLAAVCLVAIAVIVLRTDPMVWTAIMGLLCGIGLAVPSSFVTAWTIKGSRERARREDQRSGHAYPNTPQISAPGTAQQLPGGVVLVLPGGQPAQGWPPYPQQLTAGQVFPGNERSYEVIGSGPDDD